MRAEESMRKGIKDKEGHAPKYQDLLTQYDRNPTEETGTISPLCFKWITVDRILCVHLTYVLNGSSGHCVCVCVCWGMNEEREDQKQGSQLCHH